MRFGTGLSLARVGGHLLAGLTISILVLPLCGSERRGAIRRWWSARLLRILDVRLRQSGALPPSGCMVVANHVSWLDVFVLATLRPARFVCKSDVRDWPLIGWLVASNEALFLERGSRSAAAKLNRTIVAVLMAGDTVAVFPEGTSTDGSAVLPFHGAMLQGAADAASAVVPVALRYVDASGSRCRSVAYCGDISFWESMQSIAAARNLTVELDVLTPIASPSMDRRELARQAHESISNRLARASGRSEPEEPSGLRAVPLSGTRPTDTPNPGRAAFLRA